MRPHWRRFRALHLACLLALRGLSLCGLLPSFCLSLFVLPLSLQLLSCPHLLSLSLAILLSLLVCYPLPLCSLGSGHLPLAHKLPLQLSQLRLLAIATTLGQRRRKLQKRGCIPQAP